MRRANEQTLAALDDIVAMAQELKVLFPVAVAVADEVQSSGGRSDGIAVRSSNFSDPTSAAALDGRRARRQERVKRTRKEGRAAATALRASLASATLAAD